MTKAIVVIRRKPDMGVSEFRDYWLQQHDPLASKLPGLKRYVQDHLGRMEQQGERPCDGIEELEFESPEAMETALASSEGEAAIRDLQNFADMSRTGLLYVEEVPVEVQEPQAGRPEPHY